MFQESSNVALSSFHSARSTLAQPLNASSEEHLWKTDVPCPWNLSGKWALTLGTHITLRHWSFLEDVLWSTQEYGGNETFIGRIEHHVVKNDWRVVARFGSAHNCVGRLESNGLIIIWETGNSWTRLESTSPIPQRVSSLTKSSMLWVRNLSCLNRLRTCGRILVLGVGVTIVSCLALVMIYTLGDRIAPFVGQEATTLAQWNWPASVRVQLRFVGFLVLLPSVLVLVSAVLNFETLFPPHIPSAGSGNIFEAIITAICEAFISIFISILKAAMFCVLIILTSIGTIAGICLIFGPGGSIAFAFVLLCLTLMLGSLKILLVALSHICDTLTRALGFVNCFRTPWWTRPEFSPNNWPGVSLLLPEHPDYQRVMDSFQKGCEETCRMYPFRLKVIEIYRVHNSSLEAQYEKQCADIHNSASSAATANTNLLFHGTSTQAAQDIILGGFKLPQKAGMFGKGVYFAASPQKSWQYSQNRGDYILACDVALGKCKDLYKASVGLNPTRDLQGGGLLGFSGFGFYQRRTYDSIRAVPQSSGGAVRVTEYAIYHPRRAVPRYLLRVSEA